MGLLPPGQIKYRYGAGFLAFIHNIHSDILARLLMK